MLLLLLSRHPPTSSHPPSALDLKARRVCVCVCKVAPMGLWALCPFTFAVVPFAWFCVSRNPDLVESASSLSHESTDRHTAVCFDASFVFLVGERSGGEFCS